MIIACDFVVVDLLDGSKAYVLAVIEHAIRRVRDASFGAALDAVSTAAGIEVIRTGVRASRQNAIMERWFRSLRSELTDRTLVWNPEHLLRLLREYEGFHNGHRPHRSLGQAAPMRPRPDNVIDLEEFRVRRRDRAGGLLHEYRQVA